MNKKGQQVSLAMMGALATMLVVAIVTSSIGSRVIERVENTVPDATVAENVSRQAGQGMQQFAEFMPIVGLVVVAGIVLGVVRQFA